MNTKESTIRVVARTRRNSSCRTCGEIITWFRTFPRDKWIAFDADPVALRTSGNPILGEVVEEIDRDELHWTHCGQQSPEDQGDDA